MLKDTLEGAGFKNTTLENTTFENTLFADSMLETSWAERTRRNWMTMTSFGLQALMIGLLLLLPVLKTVGLPAARTVSTPISMGHAGAEPAPTPRGGQASNPQAQIFPGRLMEPMRIPSTTRTGPDNSSPDPVGEPVGSGGGIGGTGLPAGTGDGIPNSLFSGTRPVLPTLPPPPARAILRSSLLEGNLIRRVEPTYPPLARSARIQGSVVLVAVINKAGTIDNLHAVSGHPMLVPAAVDAVSQWRYRPYILNSEPIEVETQITVNFYLAGN